MGSKHPQFCGWVIQVRYLDGLICRWFKHRSLQFKADRFEATLGGHFRGTAAIHYQPVPDLVYTLWQLKNETLTSAGQKKKRLDRNT